MSRSDYRRCDGCRRMFLPSLLVVGQDNFIIRHCNACCFVSKADALHDWKLLRKAGIR